MAVQNAGLVDVGMFFGSVYESVVDRMSSNVTLSRVLLIDKSRPYSTSEDVTIGFQKALMRCGGISMDKQRLDPNELYKDSQSTSRWYNWGMRRSVPESLPGWLEETYGPEDNSTWILCIVFNIQGGATYMSCHHIPEDLVDFPPGDAEYRGITPLSRQFMSFHIVSQRVVDDDVEDESVLLDIAEYVSMMAGPDGCFFGMDTVDLTPAISMAVTKTGRTNFLEGLMGAISALPPRIIRVIYMTGDGTEHTQELGEMSRFPVPAGDDTKK